AHSKCCACHGYIRRQNGVGHEADLFEWSPWLNQSRPWLRIIDQVRALQMESARAQISNLKNRILAQALLHRSAPLLDVLRRRMRLHSCKSDHGRSEYSRGKVEC